MGLDAIRDKSRNIIHEAFSLSASARSPNGDKIFSGLHIRLHRDLKRPFGDLDREGFAMVIEYQDMIIVDKTQWIPKRNWTIDFGRSRVFRIKEIINESAERYVKCNVIQEEAISAP